MSTSTCSSIQEVINDVIVKNTQIKKQYDNSLAALNNKRNELQKQFDDFVLPQNDRNRYSYYWTDENYNCDGARNSHHVDYCAGASWEFPSGSYEYTGYEETTWGGGPCRTTKGKCQLKQSVVDNLYNKRTQERNDIQTKINGITSDIGNLKLVYYPIPNVSCCQSIEFQNISADKITYDDVKQSCAYNQTKVASQAAGAVEDLATGAKDSADTNVTNALLIIASSFGALLIIIAILLFIKRTV